MRGWLQVFGAVLFLHALLTIGMAALFGELDQDAEVVEPLAKLLDALDLGLQARQFRGDALGVLLVVPQVGGRDLLLKLRDLRLLAGGVDDGLDGGQRPVERGNLLQDVCGCH